MKGKSEARRRAIKAEVKGKTWKASIDFPPTIVVLAQEVGARTGKTWESVVVEVLKASLHNRLQIQRS